MRGRTLTALLGLALSSNATPLAQPQHRHLHGAAHRDSYSPRAVPVPPVPAPVPAPAPVSGGDFQISISNNCGSDLQFGIYQITSSFDMIQISGPVPVPAGGQGAMSAPFNGVGMRMSGTAGDGTASQWGAQALFEFGYSSYGGMEGTAYDASVMGGDQGVAVYPQNPACPSKVCSSTSCAAGQGWTDPNQVNAGSPADTVCYHGKTNFHVVWCP